MLQRRVVAARCVAGDDGVLVVAGLGASAWDLAAAGDRDRTFPLWGAMGGAIPLGLGLALARPDERVLVVTGDGEALMGLGSLATVAARRPANLSVLVLDNERYGETGMQATHTAAGVDLAAVAAGCGFPVAVTVTTAEELDPALDRRWPGPSLVVVKVSTEPVPLVVPPRDGHLLAQRFRRAVVGEP